MSKDSPAIPLFGNPTVYKGETMNEDDLAPDAHEPGDDETTPELQSLLVDQPDEPDNVDNDEVIG
jgi:hypothetical protein